MNEDKQRFQEIIEEISSLTEEAISLLPENMKNRAKSYWYAHIITSLNDDSDFMGRSMHNMQDSLEEWIDLTDDSYTSSGFNNQAEEGDYVAMNPHTRSYCIECGKDYSTFMHNCSETIVYNEVYGCSTCDDKCGNCRV